MDDKSEEWCYTNTETRRVDGMFLTGTEPFCPNKGTPEVMIIYR